MAGNRKAGPVTLALGLIFFGCVLLTANFTGTGIFISTLKYWPVLLIGLGLEYFCRSYLNKKNNAAEVTRFHFPTVLVILLVAVISYSGQQVAGVFKNQELSSFINEAVAGSNFKYNRDYKYKPLAVKPGVTKIVIGNIHGRVDLVPSPDGKLHIGARITAWGPSTAEARKRAEMVGINVEEGDVISISGSPDRIFNNRRPAEITYRVMLPKGVSVAAENAQGDVRADNVEADLDINAQNGNIIIKDAAQNVRVINENGRIDISSTRPVKANYSITNRNGEIVLRIPGKSDATVTAQIQNGTVSGSLDLKMARTQDNGQAVKGTVTLGSGTGAINLSSENGNIIVDKY